MKTVFLVVLMLVGMFLSGFALAATGSGPSALSIFDQLGAYAKVWVPILVFVLMNVATGLSHYPVTSGLAATLKRIANFFSVLTFKDMPGTLQLPFHGGRAARALQVRYKRWKLAGRAALVVVLALGAGIAAAPACASWGTKGKAIGDGVVDCGKAAVQAEMANVLPAVMAILNGGAADWKAQLDALQAVGYEALICAVHAVASNLSTPSQGPHPAERAAEYLGKARFAR